MSWLNSLALANFCTIVSLSNDRATIKKKKTYLQFISFPRTVPRAAKSRCSACAWHCEILTGAIFSRLLVARRVGPGVCGAYRFVTVLAFSAAETVSYTFLRYFISIPRDFSDSSATHETSSQPSHQLHVGPTFNFEMDVNWEYRGTYLFTERSLHQCCWWIECRRLGERMEHCIWRLGQLRFGA